MKPKAFTSAANNENISNFFLALSYLIQQPRMFIKHLIVRHFNYLKFITINLRRIRTVGIYSFLNEFWVWELIFNGLIFHLDEIISSSICLINFGTFCTCIFNEIDTILHHNVITYLSYLNWIKIKRNENINKNLIKTTLKQINLLYHFILFTIYFDTFATKYIFYFSFVILCLKTLN